MQKGLERALDRAESVIESVRQRPPKSQSSSSGEKSLHEKLYDIYVEECGKEPEVTEELMSNVNLLEKLLQRESLPHLVVSLSSGDEGCSLMLKGSNEACSESIQLPYKEREFLEYLDAEQLPPLLVDALEKAELNVFQSGCVIAEIRDYRRYSNAELTIYQSRHILLRPTMQTLVHDVESIASNNPDWTEEDKLMFESQLILATAEPLCLDPSVSVACTTNKLLYNKQKMNTPPMRRNLKRYSTASQDQEQAQSCSSAPQKKSKKSQAAQPNDLKISKAGNRTDLWKQRACELAVPSEVDVEKYAREERSGKHDDPQSTEWPAYVAKYDDDSLFGNEAGDESQKTLLTFMQSLNDPFISGKGNSPEKASCGRPLSPPLPLTDDHAYSLLPESDVDTGNILSLFEELAQESPECAFEVSQGSLGSAGFSLLSAENAAEALPAVSFESLEAREGGQHTPAVISFPSGSASSSAGTSGLTPQQAGRIRIHKLPPAAPALKPPSLVQSSSVEGSRASKAPAASGCPTSSTAPASQAQAYSAGCRIMKSAGPIPTIQFGVSGPSARQGSPATAKAPGTSKSVRQPSRNQPPNVQPTVSQAPPQGMIHFNLENLSGFKPVGLLWVPQNLDIWKNHQPQPLLCQFISAAQAQQPFTSQQSVWPGSSAQGSSAQGSSALGSASQHAASSAQPSAGVHPYGAESVLGPQVAGESQPGSVQMAPGQSCPQQGVPISSAFLQPLQPQQVRFRILPPQLVAAATAAQPGAGQQMASQPKGKGNGGRPSTRKS